MKDGQGRVEDRRSLDPAVKGLKERFEGAGEAEASQIESQQSRLVTQQK